MKEMKEMKAEIGKICNLTINPDELPPVEAGECYGVFNDFPSIQGKEKPFKLKIQQMKQYMATYFNEKNVPVGIHIFDAFGLDDAKEIAESDDYARGRASYTLGEVVPVASELLGSCKDVTECSLFVGEKEVARVSAQVVPPTPVRGDFRFENEEE